MKMQFLLSVIAAAGLASCSSAYKASQTPDDVYFSPGKAKVEKVAKADKYENYIGSEDDQYLRMKVRDRDRWSNIDDYAYWNDSRYYAPTYNYDYYRNNWYGTGLTIGMYSPFYSPFTSYYSPMWGGLGFYGGYYTPSYYGYYNPYGYNYGYGNVYISKYPAVRQSSTNRPNLNGYLNNSFRNNNNLQGSSRQGLGGSFRRVFSNQNNDNSFRTNNNNQPSSAPTRSYSPSPSGGSSSGGSSSGGGVTRPPRH